MTAAGAVLCAATAVAQIDRVLLTAITESKPVYLGVPTDVATARVPAANLGLPLRRSPSSPEAMQELRAALDVALAGHASVTVLAGPQIHRRRLEGQLAATADLPGVRIATQAGAKAMLDEGHPASLGTYLGAMTRSESTRVAVDLAPLLILAGTTMSDVLTGLFTQEFTFSEAIELGISGVRVGAAHFPGVRLEESTRILRDAVAARAFRALPPLSLPPSGGTRRCLTDRAAAGPLTQDRFWSEVQSWLPDDVIAIADVGTALYGALELAMPTGSDLLAQPVWSSIGYTLPATLGVCLAAPDRRAVLFIGDGAAQLTVGELATILHRGLTPIIVLLNNGGYTIERVIQSPGAVYQNISSWDWTALPAAFAPDVPVATMTVRTPFTLAAALSRAGALTDRAVLIEVVLDLDDAPELLVRLGRQIRGAVAQRHAGELPQRDKKRR